MRTTPGSFSLPGVVQTDGAQREVLCGFGVAEVYRGLWDTEGNEDFPTFNLFSVIAVSRHHPPILAYYGPLSARHVGLYDNLVQQVLARHAK